MDAKKEYTVESLDTIAAALSYAMGTPPPACAAPRNPALSDYVDEAFHGERADRLVMYNPDAVARWIYEKYPMLFTSVKAHTEREVPLSAVMPSVTPVCFGTMYTGAQPAVHGIQKYEKPIITVDTLFDALVRAGKRVAIVTYGACSISMIFLGRAVDYYHFPSGGIEEVNAKAAELILRDEHDVIVIYNGNYDSAMHRTGTERAQALAELRVNDHAFGVLANLIRTHWRHHNTLLGFAMDHGCHDIDSGCGSHGLDMPEDIDVVHRYGAFPRA